MKEFIARIFYYISGELHLIEKEFDKLEDAIEHGIKSLAHSFKIFDKFGNCHHDSHHHHHDGPY